MTSPLPPVLVAYNLPRVRERTAKGRGLQAATYRGLGASIGLCGESDAGVLKELAAVTKALKRLGVQCRSAGAHTLEDLRAVLATASEPVVFNLVEDLQGPDDRAAAVPSICRAFGKGCSGSDSRCLWLSTDKWLSKGVLAACGVPSPQAVLVTPGGAIPQKLPPFPLIVKPAGCDASEGIGPASVVDSPGPRLRDVVKQVHRRFGQPAMVEQFIEGREINVSLLQRGQRVEVLPLVEIDFSAFGPDKPRIVHYRAKWVTESFEYRNTPRIIPAPFHDQQAERIREMALAAWRAMGCMDYARVDFRLDAGGNPFVLEVNANPDISPEAGFSAALQGGGVKYEDFVGTVISNAASRLEPTPAAYASALGGA